MGHGRREGRGTGWKGALSPPSLNCELGHAGQAGGIWGGGAAGRGSTDSPRESLIAS